MGRVESQVKAPVEQAQLINAGAFRFDTSQEQAVGQIGGILSELGKRKQGMEDRIAVSNVNASMKKAQLDYQTEIIGKPLDQHAGILQKHLNLAKSSSLSQKMSKDARTTSESNLSAWGQTFTDTGELATITSLHKEDRIRVTADLEEAVTEGDETDIQAKLEAFNDHFATDPEAGEAMKERVMARGVATSIENQIALDPEEMKAQLDAELAARKEGKTTNEIWNEALPDAKDIDTLRDAARTELVQRETRDKITLTESAAEVEPDWLKKWTEGTLTTKEVLAWEPPITDAKAIREWNNIQEEWISKVSRTSGKGPGWSAVMQDVDLNPKQWTPSRIYAQSPKLITAEDASKMVAHWRTLTKGGNTGSASLHSGWQQTLAAQAKVGMFGKMKKEDVVNKVNDMSRQLTDFMVNNKQATTDDWRKFYGTLTEDKEDASRLLKIARITVIPIAVAEVVRARRLQNKVTQQPIPSGGTTTLTTEQKVELLRQRGVPEDKIQAALRENE